MADVKVEAIEQIRSMHPSVDITDPNMMRYLDLDLYASCALGGALNDETVPVCRHRSSVMPLMTSRHPPGIGTVLHELGVLCAPDLFVDADGLVQVADELDGFDETRHAGRLRQSSIQLD